VSICAHDLERNRWTYVDTDGRLQNFRCNKLKELSIIAMSRRSPSQLRQLIYYGFSTTTIPFCENVDQLSFVRSLLVEAVLTLAERSKKRLSELLFRVRMALVLHPRTNSLKSFVVLA